LIFVDQCFVFRGHTCDREIKKSVEAMGREVVGKTRAFRTSPADAAAGNE